MDDDGYAIRWLKAWIPSNSRSCLYGITLNRRIRSVDKVVSITPVALQPAAGQQVL